MSTGLEIFNCPFCDATSAVDFNEFGDRCTKYYRVKCAGEERHALDRWDDTPEEAIAAWNARKESSPQTSGAISWICPRCGGGNALHLTRCPRVSEFTTSNGSPP